MDKLKPALLGLLLLLYQNGNGQLKSFRTEHSKWYQGEILLDDGKVIKGQVRYNYVTGVLSIKNDTLESGFTPEKVKLFKLIYDSVEWRTRTFYSLTDEKEDVEPLKFRELIFEKEKTKEKLKKFKSYQFYELLLEKEDVALFSQHVYEKKIIKRSANNHTYPNGFNHTDPPLPNDFNNTAPPLPNNFNNTSPPPPNDFNNTNSLQPDDDQFTINSNRHQTVENLYLVDSELRLFEIASATKMVEKDLLSDPLIDQLTYSRKKIDLSTYEKSLTETDSLLKYKMDYDALKDLYKDQYPEVKRYMKKFKKKKKTLDEIKDIISNAPKL